VIHGTAAPGFEPLREEFAAVLADEPPGHDAQLAAYVDGRPVVDLWGGPSFAADSLIGVYSCTKGAAYLTVALLVQAGVLDLDREVRHYWPEYAAEGKDRVTLRELLTHRAGSIGTDAGFTPAELADDRAMAELLAPHRPYWRPGAAFGYHALTIGALAGEVVRRAAGATLKELYEREVRAPYGVEFHLGLPEALEPRVIDVLTPPEGEDPNASDGLGGIAVSAHSAEAIPLDAIPNTRAFREGGQGGGGGGGGGGGPG
jgi:CubicO group peptidase (beta-lactamase class C family)